MPIVNPAPDGDAAVAALLNAARQRRQRATAAAANSGGGYTRYGSADTAERFARNPNAPDYSWVSWQPGGTIANQNNGTWDGPQGNQYLDILASMLGGGGSGGGGRSRGGGGGVDQNALNAMLQIISNRIWDRPREFQQIIDDYKAGSQAAVDRYAKPIDFMELFKQSRNVPSYRREDLFR